MPWLAASSSAGRASGSWTFHSSWRSVEPADVAASTTVGGTARMPASTSRMTGGTAKMTAATIAVNRLGSNSATAGIR